MTTTPGCASSFAAAAAPPCRGPPGAGPGGRRAASGTWSAGSRPQSRPAPQRCNERKRGRVVGGESVFAISEGLRCSFSVSLSLSLSLSACLFLCLEQAAGAGRPACRPALSHATVPPRAATRYTREQRTFSYMLLCPQHHNNHAPDLGSGHLTSACLQERATGKSARTSMDVFLPRPPPLPPLPPLPLPLARAAEFLWDRVGLSELASEGLRRCRPLPLPLPPSTAAVASA